MPQGTLKNSKDAYVHYEFVCVKCRCCGIESNPFVYKDHLTADETIKYVTDITGFSVDKLRLEELTEGSFVNTGKGYERGGLCCPMCDENKLKEVV